MAQSVGPLNHDDEDERDDMLTLFGGFFFALFVEEQADHLGLVDTSLTYGGTDWETAVVTVQYRCDGETWMVQYVAESHLHDTLHSGTEGKVRSAFRM